MKASGSRELKKAWGEFQEGSGASGIHVGTLEAMQVLREATSGTQPDRRQASATDEEEELGRFLDWLLHVKKERALAYELLRREGSIDVGPRQYWATEQRGRRAIAWESRYTYPGTDSEIWDVIMVDEG